MSLDLAPFFLSLKLAFFTTIFIFILGIWLVFLLTSFRFWLRPLVKSVVSLPLVLPPTVIGYYLLVAFRPEGSMGALFDQLFDMRLAFSFTGLVLGSIIFSLPFMVNPIVAALENLPESYSEAAYTLGKSKMVTFWRVLLPNVKPAIFASLLLTFAHTIGEFGVVLMIGGNIPGQTQVASIAIYNEVEALNYHNANVYAISLLLFSLVGLALVYFFQQAKSPRAL